MIGSLETVRLLALLPSALEPCNVSVGRIAPPSLRRLSPALVRYSRIIVDFENFALRLPMIKSLHQILVLELSFGPNVLTLLRLI